MKLTHALVIISAIFLFAFRSHALVKLDINSASQAEIEALPGVGKKTAEDIVARRPFTSVEQLQDIKGIGQGKYNKIRNLVTIGAASAAMQPSATKPSASQPSLTPSSPAASSRTYRNEQTINSDKPAVDKVSLNQATQEQLEALPGIGPVKARAIIQARPFNNIEDVMKIRGIKEGTFVKIKDRIIL